MKLSFSFSFSFFPDFGAPFPLFFLCHVETFFPSIFGTIFFMCVKRFFFQRLKPYFFQFRKILSILSAEIPQIIKNYTSGNNFQKDVGPRKTFFILRIAMKRTFDWPDLIILADDLIPENARENPVQISETAAHLPHRSCFAAAFFE